MSREALEKHVKPYVVTLGSKEHPIYIGPDIKDRFDAYYIKISLGVNAIINMHPLTDDEHWSGENRASPYMRFFNNKDEPVEELQVNPPRLYRDAALPKDPLDQQSDKKQIDFYVSRAEKLAEYVREHKVTPYIHYRDGTCEEAFIGFLLWYILDKQTCPWENLTAWLCSEEIDQKQVLTDDAQVELFGKMIQQLKKAAKNPIMSAWLAKKPKK